jgi:hypothetical protein
VNSGLLRVCPKLAAHLSNLSAVCGCEALGIAAVGICGLIPTPRPILLTQGVRHRKVLSNLRGVLGRYGSVGRKGLAERYKPNPLKSSRIFFHKSVHLGRGAH